MLDKKFKLNTIVTYCTNGFLLISGFVLMFLINRYFGIATYGELSIVSSLTGVVGAVFTAKSNEAVVRFFTREKALGNQKNAKLIVILGLSTDLISSVFVFAFFLILSEFAANFFLNKPELSSVVQMYGLITIFTFIKSSINGYFQSNEYFNILNMIQIIEAILKIFLVLIVVLMFKGLNIDYIVYSYVIASFIATGFAIVLFYFKFMKEFKGIKTNISMLLIREYFNFNIKIFISTTVSSINSNIDNLMLAYFSNSLIVGIYQTLKNLATPISFVSSPFILLTTGKLVGLHTQKNLNSFNHILSKVSIFIFINGLIVTIIISLVAENIFELFNVEYVYFIEYAIFALSVVFKHSFIWWVGIVMNLYNPIKNINLSIVYFLIFQLSIAIFHIIIGLKIEIMEIILSNLIGIIFVIIFSRIYLNKFKKRDFN